MKKVQDEHNYNPLAGCVPALIQFPVFIGLYRLLRASLLRQLDTEMIRAEIDALARHYAAMPSPLDSTPAWSTLLKLARMVRGSGRRVGTVTVTS